MVSPFASLVQMIPRVYEGYVSWKRISRYVRGPPDRQVNIGEPPDPIQADEKPENSRTVVCVRDARLGWTAEPTLSSVSFDLAKGSITVVTGDPGSGKSTLAKSLVGEVNVLSGFFKVHATRVAFCDQTPFFLPNKTVRDHIILDQPFDEVLYRSVLQCCQLESDIERWPAGDSMVTVDTAGTPLSGGQRKRLAIARALYHEPELLVLDDVFTGVDPNTIVEMRKALFGSNGFLRKRRDGMAILIVSPSSK